MKNNPKYICKVYFDEKHYKKFYLSDSISDSLYELTKWATKFGATKVELTICENLQGGLKWQKEDQQMRSLTKKYSAKPQ